MGNEIARICIKYSFPVIRLQSVRQQRLLLAAFPDHWGTSADGKEAASTRSGCGRSQLIAFFTSAVIRASSAGVISFSA